MTHHGDGCVGSFGHYPVLGAKQSPSVGNGRFALELHGAAPLSGVTLLIGGNPLFQINLSIIGVTGCTLYVQTAASVGGATSNGIANRGEGTATLAMPIPNSPGLVGGKIQVQAVVLDVQNGRTIPVTLTNALEITIQ